MRIPNRKNPLNNSIDIEDTAQSSIKSKDFNSVYYLEFGSYHFILVNGSNSPHMK